MNHAVKYSLRRSFHEWYSTEVRKQLDKGIPQPVDLSMSVVKPLGAMWLMNAFEYIKSNPSLIINGFKGACWNIVTFESNCLTVNFNIYWKFDCTWMHVTFNQL